MKEKGAARGGGEHRRGREYGGRTRERERRSVWKEKEKREQGDEKVTERDQQM